MVVVTTIRSKLWRLVRDQHGVVSWEQLLAHGLTPAAIRHRVRVGRLHRVHLGVYAVGRPVLTLKGRWMAAVLCCGQGAALSHQSAAMLWGITATGPGTTHVSVPVDRRPQGIKTHFRSLADQDIDTREGIPLTNLPFTLVDLATMLGDDSLDRAVNEADRLDLIDPESLRAAIERSRRPGAGRLRAHLDKRTFTLTDSVLERRFLKLAQQAGLPRPLTQQLVNGYRVDFSWPDKLVVETDGLRYHRTPAQQAKDLLRDQAHTAAGLTTLRFTHAQVIYEPDYVRATLERTAGRTSSP